jgi:hypothetical protein
MMFQSILLNEESFPILLSLGGRARKHGGDTLSVHVEGDECQGLIAGLPHWWTRPYGS